MPGDPTKAKRRATSGRRRAAPARARAGDVDRHVAARIRERRVGLGLSQIDLAGLVGVTGQQLHKYERGSNRITVGRLHAIARALGVEVGHFFEGMGDGAAAGDAVGPTPRRRMMLGLARDFSALPDREQEAICRLAHALTDRDQDQEPGDGQGAANGHV